MRRGTDLLSEDEQVGMSCLAYRRLSTSIFTSKSSDGAFPSDLLSTKSEAVKPNCKIGLYQDVVIPVMNFHNEDKGFMVLACEIFDVPIRKDIIHHDNREWIFVSSHIMKEGKLSRDS